MVRELVISIGLHVGIGAIVYFGLPSIPISLPLLDESDIDILLVTAEEDMPILQAETQAPENNRENKQENNPENDDVEETAPDGAVEETPNNPNPEQNAPVDPPKIEETNTTDDKRLDVAQTEVLEVEVDKVIVDFNQEASLGNGKTNDPNDPSDPRTPENSTQPQPTSSDQTSDQTIDPMGDIEQANIEGSDVDALNSALQSLDQFPEPDPDVRQAVEKTFAESNESEKPKEETEEDTNTASDEPKESDIDTTSEDKETPAETQPDSLIDESAENAFATLPVPRVRPRRVPTYINTEAPEDQDKIVSAARRTFPDPTTEPVTEPEPVAEPVAEPKITPEADTEAKDKPANMEDQIADNIAASSNENAHNEANKTQQQWNDLENASSQSTETALRKSVNDTALRTISESIKPDWPTFSRGQYGWAIRVTVHLADIDGNFLSIDESVEKTPARATQSQIESMKRAAGAAVSATQPWPIPIDYAEDWLIPITFVICPIKSVLSSGARC